MQLNAKRPEFYEKDTKVGFGQIERLLECLDGSCKAKHFLCALPKNLINDSGAKKPDSYEYLGTAIPRITT